MRKWFAALLAMIAVFSCACARTSEPRVLPEKGEFSFALPAGYTYGDIQDTACVIYNGSGTAVGGIRLADLLPKELKTDNPAVPQYLDSLIPGCEFFIWLGDDPKNPVQYVSQQFTDTETQERRAIYRILFVRDDIVYDLHLNPEVIAEEEIAKFHPIAEGK